MRLHTKIKHGILLFCELGKKQQKQKKKNAKNKRNKTEIEQWIQLERANVQIKGKNSTLSSSSCNKSARAVINIDFEIVPMGAAGVSCVSLRVWVNATPTSALLHLDLSLILAAEMKIVFQSYSCRLPFALLLVAIAFLVFPIAVCSIQV